MKNTLLLKNYFKTFLLLAFLAFGQIGFGQINATTSTSMTSSSAVSEPFNATSGTNAFLSGFPTAWSLVGSGTTGNGVNTATPATGSTTAGWYGNNDLGYLGSGNASLGNATWRLQNNTGSQITGFSVSYKARMYKNGSGTPSLQVSYSTNSSGTVPAQGSLTAISSLTVGDAATFSSTVNTTGVTLTTSPSNNVTGLTIANTNYIYLRFIFSGGSSSDLFSIDDVTITPVLATTPSIAATATLSETMLNNSTIALTLSNDTFANASPVALSNFTLNNAPSGVTIASVTYNTTTTATVTLAYNNTDFDATVSNMTVSVAAAELTSATALTSNSLTVTAVTETIAASPTTLTGLNYVFGSGPSASQSFAISSANLKLPAGNITITGSTNYEVSTDNTNYFTSVTVPFSSATLASTPIYVRLKSGLAVASYNAQTIAVSGGGATSSVTVSGAVTGAPPVNDLCVNSIALSAGTPSNGTTSGATFSANTFTYGSSKNDVWYTFTPTCTGSHTVTLTFSKPGSEDLDFDIFSTVCPTTGTASFTAHGSTATETATQSLTSGVTYYIRVIDFTASNIAFTLNVNAPTPVTASVTAGTVSNLGSTSATLNGNVTALGVCPATTSKGFVYALTSVTATPTILNSSSAVAGLTAGAFTFNLNALTPSTSYSYSAYVYDGTNYTYSTPQTFTTIEAATKLVLVGVPSTGNVGTNLTTFTVQAQNSTNVVDINYTGTITINKVSGSGVLSGATATAVAGVASFNAVQFNSADTYTINASATGLITSPTSGNIVIVLAPIALQAWDFFGQTQASTTTFAATTYNSNLDPTVALKNITRGAGAPSSTGNNSFRTTGFQNDGIDIANTDYFQTSLKANLGYSISLTAIDAIFVGTATYTASPGVSTQFAYSLNGGAYNLIGTPSIVTTASLTMPQVDLSNILELQNIPSGSTVNFRFYASGQTATGGFGFSSATSGTNGLTFSGYIQANAFIWTGTTGNWSVGTNWLGGVAPDGTKDVVITTGAPTLDVNYTVPSGTTLTVSGTGSLTINSLNTLTVAGTAAFNNKNVILKSDNNGTAAIGQVTGTISGATNVTVERYLKGRRAFRFLTPGVTTTTSIFQNWQNNGAPTAGIGTQITGGAANGFDASGSNNPSLHTYDAQVTGTTTTGFIAATNTNATVLKAGVGYRVLVRGDRNINLFAASADDMNVPTTLSATGTLTTGTVIFDATAGSPAPINNNPANTQTNGYTLIGNPYASPVDWHAVTKIGVSNNAYYTWDPTLGTSAQRGRYVVYSADTASSNIYLPSIGTDGVSDRRFLQSGQAVFVKNADLNVSATLTFNESNKATTNAYVFRSSNESLTSTTTNASLYLTVYEPNELALGGAPIDGALAQFGTDYNTSLDANDVAKLSTSGENLAFVRENKNLAIETVAPVVADDVLFVKTIAFQANKNYTFKVNTTNFDTTVNAKMVDMYLNTETPIDLTQPAFVSFTTTADANSYGSERFKIVFNSAALGNGAFNTSSVAVYPNPIVNNQFTIALPTAVTGNVTVRMSNILGQEVYKVSGEATPTMQIQPKQQLEEGVYVVSITNNGQLVQTKVIVKK